MKDPRRQKQVFLPVMFLFFSGQSVSSISSFHSHQQPELQDKLCPQLCLSQVRLCDRISSSEVLVDVCLLSVGTVGIIIKWCIRKIIQSLSDQTVVALECFTHLHISNLMYFDGIFSSAALLSVCYGVSLPVRKVSCLFSEQQPQGLFTSLPCTEDCGSWLGSDCDLPSSHHLQAFQLWKQQQQQQKVKELIVCCSFVPWPIYYCLFTEKHLCQQQKEGYVVSYNYTEQQFNLIQF